MPAERLTLRQALERAQRYCARQERCHQQVRDKLYGWGLHREDVEQVIAELIAQNFLNEQRFATAFTVGKIRQNGWGLQKIRQHLLARKVAKPSIDLAAGEIDETEYLQILQALAVKKFAATQAPNAFTRRMKTIAFLRARGFNGDHIAKVMDQIDG